VTGLQAAFHINRFLQIKESFQTPEGVAPTDVTSVKKACQCPVHGGRDLELYCETCGELICTWCALKNGKHCDHNYNKLEQAFERYKVEIASLLEPIEKQVTTIRTALAKLNACSGAVSDQQAATLDNIRSTFSLLREVLDNREAELISQLDGVTQSKLSGLAAQRDQIEITLAQTCSCLYFMRESLKTDNEGNVLMMKTSTIKQANGLIVPFPADLCTEADLEFLTSADMTTELLNYGQIFVPSIPDPSKCKVDVNSKVAIAGEKCSAVLHAINFKGESCKGFFEALEGNLVSELLGTRAGCGIERIGESQYTISYQPTIKGRHQLHITTQGQHIAGSPFRVAVTSPVEKLGNPILTIDGVVEPWGVSVNQRGEVVVTEWGGHRVSVFSPSGEKLFSFGTRGSGPGQLWYPNEVAIDGEGNMLLADGENNRIKRFTPEGISLGNYERLQFSLPTGIAFNASNNKIYVGDTFNDRLQVLTIDLTSSTSFGKLGSGKGQFIRPCGIACDSSGRVYVADRNNHRIQVFTADLKFLRMFGKCGQDVGELYYPVGVAIDANQMVYVSEQRNHRVTVFTSEGQLVMSFGVKGAGLGEFTSPKGIAVDKYGVVYVCDMDNNRVQVF
jgi:DNA-binding beta-propeller fold protein YncE